MKRIIALAIIAIATVAIATVASAQWRIRVTDPDGNVATATIGTNKSAHINAWVDETFAQDSGTSRAARVSVMLEGVVRGNAAQHAREKVRAAKRAEADAAADAVQE